MSYTPPKSIYGISIRQVPCPLCKQPKCYYEVFCEKCHREKKGAR